MNMQTTGLLLISLWAFCWARPVSRHPGAHHSSSKEHWAIAVEESLNKIADSTDLSDEDPGSRLRSSTEDRSEDLGDNSCDSCEINSFPRKVSRSSLESFSEDDHEWSTQDNEEGGYFRHQTVHRKWADSKDSHKQKEINEESSDDESAGRMSLEDRSEGHLYGVNKESKEHFDVENDGMIYTPEQVLYTFVEKGGSDLTAEEDISGDDSLDENNAEDPGHTKSPSEGDALQPPETHGEQDGGNTVGQHSDASSSSSSSSSSSESKNLEKEDNHITDYGRRHGGDSYSSSQEDGYDFQSEEMQGDDPRTFESHDSDSHMLPKTVHSKESSQEISREKGKGEAKHDSSTVEHFDRKVYHYVDGDSDEDNSPEYEKNKSLKEDDNSEVDSQLVEDSQSTENVPSQSREDATSHSRMSIESSSIRHSHSQSRETFNSHSREDKHSQSREDVQHSQSREDEKHSRSREDDKHSQSREDDKHSQSGEDDKHSRSREDDKHSQSREDDKHSRSAEGDKHNRSGEDDKHSRSREDKHSHSAEHDKHSWSEEDVTRGHSQSQSKEDISSHSREEKHSQSREDDVHSQSRELARQSRGDEETVSEEDIKSESTEDPRNSQEKAAEKSKETEEESNEHSASKSKEQESHSVEKSGSMPPRATESREFKWHPSRSSEKSSSMEESEESAEDTKESTEDDSKLSQSASSESSKLSEESASSDDSNSNEEGQQSQSAETSESKEEDSHSIERHSQSREGTSQSDSMEDNSWSRSLELENRKLMLDIYHNKPFSDYDDNDCQDGY